MKVSYGKILVAVAVFGLCLGAAFAAGTVYGRHSQTNAAAASIGTFSNQNGTGSRANGTASTSNGSQSAPTDSGTPQSAFPLGGGQGFAGGFAGRPIEGKVDSINTAQLQLTIGSGARAASGNGASTTIALDGKTTYASSQQADKSTLTNGAPVYVTTTAASDGTVIAQSVLVLPANTASSANQSTGSNGGNATGSGGQGFGGGRGFGGNRPIDGTVASLSGDQLQITLANGSSTTVTVNSQTTYATTSTTDLNAVTSGASVLVTINRGTDGSLSASSIIILPTASQSN